MPMGYVPRRTLYKLDFSETEHAGLEVVTRSASMAALLDIMTLADEVESAGVKKAGRADLDRLFALFDEVLHDWNVETEDGEPVPPTMEGLLSQDPSFVMTVITAWGQAMTRAPADLGKGSGSGGISEVTPPGLAEASLASSPGRRF
jgi:hypothetical protein